MKKYIFFAFALLIISISSTALAGPGGGTAPTSDSSTGDSTGTSSTGDSSNQTGSILDYIGLSTGGCGAPPDTSCDDSGGTGTGIFSTVACKVMKAFNAGVIPLYCSIVSNPDYLNAVDAAMLLYVIWLGISFMFGLVPARFGTVAVKTLKAIIIYTLIINADLYFSLIYNNVFQTTQDVVKILLNANTGAGSGTGAQNFFDLVDKGMREVLGSVYQSAGSTESGQSYTKTGLKIIMMGFAIWQLGGDLVGGLFFAVIIGWILNYFSIMVRYLLAMLSMMFLLMLGPLFIPTLLFDRTKDIGETWYTMILCFMMQIVVVVAFVLMIQSFYIQLYDMVKTGLENGTVMSQSPDKMLATFDNNANNGAYKPVDNFTTLGSNSQDAEQYFSQVFGGDYKTQLPQMIIKLIELLVVIYTATLFLAALPGIAALLIGQPRFIMMFMGNDSFGGKRSTQANLFGQGASRASQNARDVRSAQEISKAAPDAAAQAAKPIVNTPAAGTGGGNAAGGAKGQ